MNNIILTGFMGTGKSSVGKVLAKLLMRRFVDLDELIEAEAGMAIKEIFACHGEPHFRALEAEMIKRLEVEEDLVLSTGGGAVISPENRRRMRRAGRVVNLTASVAAIQKRLMGDGERPLLKDDKSSEKIAAMLTEREPFYADADIRIDTTDKKLEDVLSEILVWLKRAG
jgi:shikimate kinase